MKRVGLIIALIAGIFWGVTGGFVRVLTDGGLDNPTIIFMRFAIGAVLMIIVLFFYNRELLKIKPKDIWLFACSGIVSMVGLNIFYNVAINSLSIGFAAVLLDTAPFFVLIMAAIFFHEKITKLKVLCLILAIVGCVLVSGFLETLGATNWSTLGVICGVLSAIFFASYSVFSKFAIARGYHPLTITCYSMITGAIALAFFADYPAVGAYVAAAPGMSMLMLVGQSICCAVLAYFLFSLALTYSEAGKVSIIAGGSEPTAAMILGALCFSEIPSWLMILGLALVVVALSLLVKAGDSGGDDSEAGDPGGGTDELAART